MTLEIALLLLILLLVGTDVGIALWPRWQERRHPPAAPSPWLHEQSPSTRRLMHERVELLQQIEDLKRANQP